jgi:hypothetical protein
MLKNVLFFVLIALFLGSCTSDNVVLVPLSIELQFRSDYPNAEDVSWVDLGNDVYEVSFVHNFEEVTVDYRSTQTKKSCVSFDENHDGSHDKGDRHPREEVSLDSLCEGITSYISTNYPGYNTDKAYKFTRDSVTSFMVLISNDSTKFRLLFDVDCNFVKVANGHIGGGHHGGHGPHGGGGHHGGGSGPGHGNDGGHGSYVDITTLPANLIAYVSTNYSGYSVHKAKKIKFDGVENIVIVLKDANGNIKKLLFDTSGNFIKEL